MGDVASFVSLRDCELREVGNDADLLLAEPLLAADPGPPQDPLQQVHTNDSPMGVRNGHYEIFWGTLHPLSPCASAYPSEGFHPIGGGSQYDWPSRLPWKPRR